MFTPVPGVPAAQTVGVTLWTDVAPGVIPTTTSRAIDPAESIRSLECITRVAFGLAAAPDELCRSSWIPQAPAESAIACRACIVLFADGQFSGDERMQGSGSSSGGGTGSPNLTPTGKFNVTLTVSGPNNTVQTMPIQFTVAAGVAGQE